MVGRVEMWRGGLQINCSRTAPIASGWSNIAGWDSHPLENAAFARRTPIQEVRHLETNAWMKTLPCSCEHIRIGVVKYQEVRDGQNGVIINDAAVRLRA